MANTLIFDIGKTNKKYFLFDEKYKVVFQESIRFEEIKDEDGVPCDDLVAIENWIKTTFNNITKNKNWSVKAVNFSTYGASFVHIDKNGKLLTPLYNYLKPYPSDLLQDFYKKYGDELQISRETASPALAMLNSGLQLYWLKYARPEIFKKIRWSLHLPQYFSYLFTEIPISEFTSIGCHTALWNYEKKDYHDWVYAEGIDRILPPIVSTDTSINGNCQGKKIKIGVGIHDSSAALFPYIREAKKPFLLISTGTWSIALNPFNTDLLSNEDLQNDCLNYMRIDGQPVKAARLFLGNEYELQVKKVQIFYNVAEDIHKKITFNPIIYKTLNKDYQRYFAFESLHIERQQSDSSSLKKFESFEIAYHQLMLELVELQIVAIQRTIGNMDIQKIYIDGGFADNDLFVKLLTLNLKNKRWRTTQSPLGSALGAAMVLGAEKIKKGFFK